MFTPCLPRVLRGSESRAICHKTKLLPRKTLWAEIEEGKRSKGSRKEEKNKEVEASLEFAYTSIEELNNKLAEQDEETEKLKKGAVKSLTKQAAYEKQRAINLESHSRRNDLNFFIIPVQKD